MVFQQFQRHKHLLLSLEYVVQEWGCNPLTPNDAPNNTHSADSLFAKLNLPALEELHLAIESEGLTFLCCFSEPVKDQ